ncbi:MAG: hypothetical protein ACK4PH_17230 [Aquincola tertiaricarbonis]|uniref:hypothetical protein n=1 Tax=Aquincola TaxID=391952 RepID=UPI0006151306|nr:MULTISPECIES: hypothetical protein [Aquincola]MCR5864150.1 hypothetical protein [Aquincola sp. J276]
MKHSIIVGTLGGLLGLAGLPAAAEEFRCTGRVGAVALDNIYVPDNASCVLDRTRAKGSIVVGHNARLQATSVSINGNLQAEGAADVRVGGASTFGGSVQIVKGGSASIGGARINGDIQFDENVGPLWAGSNVVGGDLQAFKNMAGVTLLNNRMNGNLQCKENIPAPTGSGNRAASKEDQCARL